MRERYNLSQRDLEARTGIHQADISRIERAEANPSLATMTKIVGGLGCDLDFSLKKKRDILRHDIPLVDSVAKYLDNSKVQGEFTIEDIDAIPEGNFVELIDGVIYEGPQD